MKDRDNRESGKAGKPGESTARGAATTAPEADTTTAAGITGLLQSEFASAEPEARSGEEVPTEERPGETETETETETEAEAETPAETEAETPAEAEAETPAEAAVEMPTELQAAIDRWEADGRGRLPEPLQALFDRRINKATAQRKEAETRATTAESRVQELEVENQELKSSPTRPAPASVGAVDEKHLLKLEGTAEVFLGEAEAYLDDSANDEERGRIERYMAEQNLDLAKLKRKVREVSHWLNREAPAQRKALEQFRQQEAAVEPDVQKHFPWLDKKDSPEYKTAQQVLALVPELAVRTPAHRIALGVYVLGLKEFERLKAGKAGTRTPTKAPNKAPVNGTAAPAGRVNGRQQAETVARQTFESRMDRDSVTELLKSGLRA